MVDYEALGKRMKIKRKAKRLSQAQLASLVNISTAFYGNIERGIRIPSIDTLVAIANVLNVGTDWLLAESVKVAGKMHTREELRILSRYLRDQIEELDYNEQKEEQ